MGYSPRSLHSQHCPTAIFFSAPTISNKKKPSPSTELLCGADEIRTRAGARFHIHVTPWHFVPSPRGTEVASPNLLLRLDHQQQKKPSPSTELLCGADEIRTRDLRRDRPAF